MITKVTESTQRFSELYPDAELRHQMHYGFAHEFLPKYVHYCPWAFFVSLFNYDLQGGSLTPGRFIRSRWQMMEAMMGVVSRKTGLHQEIVCTGIAELDMWVMNIHNRPLAFIEMPRPERPGQAYYVAIALLTEEMDPTAWPRQVRAQYFLAEKIDRDEAHLPQPGCFGEKDEQHRHLQHYCSVNVTLEAFKDYVGEAAQKDKHSIAMPQDVR